MSTITCNSCGFEYDGTGLQPGVQFQCTECGSMVVVGAAPPPARATKRPTGRPRAVGGPTRGPARGPTRGPLRPQPMAGGPQQQMQDQQAMPYGPPKSGSNAGLFVGLGVGVVIIIIVIVAIVLGSGPAPEDLRRQQAEKLAKEREEQNEKRRAEQRAEGEAIKKPTEASMSRASDVFAALQNEDASLIESLFDWQVYAAYNRTLVEGDEKYLNSPLIAVGTWEKDDAGKYTGSFIGDVPHGADGLRKRIMDYIREFIFGAAELQWERAKTESDSAGSFSLEVNGTLYYGKRVYITYRGAGKTKELWIGAPRGTDNVRLLNYVDGSSIKNLQSIEAKRERDPADQRDPYNPDRDPRNPDRDRPRDPDMEDEPYDADADLPAMAKTGAMPKEPALVNAVKELEKGRALNTARIRQIEGEPSRVQKKATMGAFIDLLIDAQKSKNRSDKLVISSALWEVWGPFVPTDWGKSEMVYTQDFDGQSESDLPVQRWLYVYNEYKTD